MQNLKINRSTGESFSLLTQGLFLQTKGSVGLYLPDLYYVSNVGWCMCLQGLVLGEKKSSISLFKTARGL